MAEPGQLIRSLSARPAARNFHTFVINEIGMGVASGAFAAGTTLPNDAEMIGRYGVSRTVLREALKTLEAKGMVEARAKVGTRVQPRSRWNLVDRQVLFWIFHAPPEHGFLESLTEVRGGLELQATRLAAERRQAEQIRMMRYWLSQHEIAAHSAEGAGLAAFEIHRLVAEASQNVILRSAIVLAEFGLAAALRAQLGAGVEDFSVGKAHLYAALVDHVEAGHPQFAVATMDAILTEDAAVSRLGQPAP